MNFICCFRLTKYPLLFENLVKHTKNNPEEEKCVQRALERSKEILNRVNEAVKEAEDEHRLAEIQRKLDKSSFDKVDHPVTNEFKVRRLWMVVSIGWSIGLCWICYCK